MNTAPYPDRPEAPLFCDGLGERVVAADASTGELLQILRIRQELTAVPSFEFALRERAARLANFRHAYYARVRRVDRVQLPAPGLAVVSDHVEGTRLSDMLRVAHERGLHLDINAALCLIRQLVPGVGLLHENAREVAHGLIAPERLIVTPHGRLVIVEHVLAAAIEQLQYSRERLWQEFRSAVSPSAGPARFDHRADVAGIGLVALALVLGRPLEPGEYPHRLLPLIAQARERTALGDEQPLSEPLRDWLSRVLQLDPRRAFTSAPETFAALEDVIAENANYVAAPVALETFLTRYIASLLEPAVVAAPPAPARMTSVRPLEDRHGHGDERLPDVSAPSPHLAPAPTRHQQSPVPQPAVPSAPGSPPSFSEASPTLPEGGVQATPPASSPAMPGLAPAAAQPPDTASWALLDGQSAAVATARDLAELISAADLPVLEDDTPAPAAAPVFHSEFPPAVPKPDAKPEAERSRPMASPKRRPQIPRRSVVAVLAVLAVVLVGGASSWHFRPASAAVAPTAGTLVVQSNPPDLPVFVDGIELGVTPLRVSVEPGTHILELRGSGVPRVIPFNLAAGAEISHHVEFASTPQTGALRVESQPAGARVLVDGVERGLAPLTVEELTPGDHQVVLQTSAGSVRHSVNVQAGGTASLVAPVAATASPAGPVSGWLTVKAPFSLEILEAGRVVGTTDADRIMMAAGRREIELVNERLGFRATRVVQVVPGKVASLTVDLPNGLVNLNAAPWAEVWIDGKRVGETPIGNLSVPIGAHEIVFRHPQFGEKRHAISVTAGEPVRLSVDMR